MPWPSTSREGAFTNNLITMPVLILTQVCDQLTPLGWRPVLINKIYGYAELGVIISRYPGGHM
jgi:hypothetical protein